MASLVEKVVQNYGDLLFDLCESVLSSANHSQAAFRSILKEIRRTDSAEQYQENERAWILRIAFEKLKKLSSQYGFRITASEQMELDASPTVSARLKHFDVYFHRLTVDEQMVLLLRDKYGLPYGEIAGAMALPEGTLKSLRQQALRTLENWVWDDESASVFGEGNA